MYVEVVPSKQRGKIYTAVLIRESYRQQGKVKHRTLANITKLPAPVIDQIKRILAGEQTPLTSLDPIRTLNSREYGASYAFLELARCLHLDKLIYSRKAPWREDLMAMIIGRLVYQGSKLRLTNLFADSALWELCGHRPGERPDVEKHAYEPLDRLLQRQPAIQKALAQRHLKDRCLILYDLTSCYLEGAYETSKYVTFGRNRDGKRGHEQIAIGLLCDKEGCPLAVEVFGGNCSEQKTVLKQVKRLAETYQVEEIIFAGDRGMLTPKRIREVNEVGFKTLTALTHPQIQNLLERKVIQYELFDERGICEVCDPEQPQLRYMLCKNPRTEQEETATRNALIGKTQEGLAKLAQSKRKGSDQKLSAKVGVLLAKYKVGKFFNWQVQDGGLSYELDEARLQTEQALDGCYIIRTDAEVCRLSKEEAVAGYRRLARVEKAFRNLKTVSLEIRPIYHHLDRRIQAHVFLCMLAYYVQWHAWQRLAPLFAEDGQGKQRRWSLKGVIERLKSIRMETCLVAGATIDMVKSLPDPEQRRILDLLQVKM